ncbi:MAG: acireductone synthase [Vicinamibacterales bacterium]
MPGDLRRSLAGIQAILLDIEGTTTPIAFVYEVLFPFARKNLRRHIEQHASSIEYSVLFDRLRDEHAADRRAGETVPPWVETPHTARLASVASYSEWLMERDRKSTALKELQGRIWEEGYTRGELVGEVFDDVPGALARWHAQHVSIGIYSSGSALAQRLLFRHSSAGDLTRFLQWYFDTTVGAKIESDSYRRIATKMSMPAQAVLFVSDVIGELDAARGAGMQTTLSIRPGNTPLPHTSGYTTIRSFDELFNPASHG